MDNTTQAHEGEAVAAGIPDVSGMTMLELMDSQDPVLVAGLSNVLSEHPVRLGFMGWSSHVDQGREPPASADS